MRIGFAGQASPNELILQHLLVTEGGTNGLLPLPIRGGILAAVRGLEQMITIAIFAVSVFLLAQFGFFYWRTLMLFGAAEELSERIEMLGPAAKEIESVVCLHRACPGYGLSERAQMALARLYHFTMKLLANATERLLPGLARWAQEEMAVCLRFATVRLDHRLARVQELAANSRSLS